MMTFEYVALPLNTELLLLHTKFLIWVTYYARKDAVPLKDRLEHSFTVYDFTINKNTVQDVKGSHYV